MYLWPQRQDHSIQANFYNQDLNTRCEKKTVYMPFKGKIFRLTNVCLSSLCEAGTITGNTSKLFCAPQLVVRFREALYTCTTWNTETIKLSIKVAAHSFTSLAQVCGQMEGEKTPTQPAHHQPAAFTAAVSVSGIVWNLQHYHVSIQKHRSALTPTWNISLFIRNCNWK